MRHQYHQTYNIIALYNLISVRNLHVCQTFVSIQLYVHLEDPNCANISNYNWMNTRTTFEYSSFEQILHYRLVESRIQVNLSAILDSNLGLHSNLYLVNRNLSSYGLANELSQKNKSNEMNVFSFKCIIQVSKSMRQFARIIPR